EVVNGTNVSALTPTITVSPGATIYPVSGTSQDFAAPFTYTVTAENGSDYQDWIVTVTEEATLSSSAEIKTFILAEQTGPAIIDSVNATVDIEVAYGTDITDLTPNITISAGASINPLGGTSQDFTFPVVYIVTAQDASTKDWTVTVSVATGIDIEVQYADIQVFPNPAHEYLTLRSDKMISQVKIYSMTGVMLFSKDVNGNVTGIDLSGLETGIFILKAQDNNGRDKIIRFIKQ
ncbi:MAG: T9SS type A sorting domain-containing protein, partial [Bacteroidota bacterium]